MFDIFAKLLSSISSFLFPLFASYKALKTADRTQLTPWLMYWVVLACSLLVESWIGWILVWIPFYAYIRLLFLLYLVLPQTQGARFIYEEYIHPRLEENETAIEEFIASAHDRLRSAGIAYLKRAIELLKTNVLGLPPSQPEPPAPEPQTPQSYTQALLARFALPTPRWSAAGTTTSTTPTSGQGLTTDFYNLLASAVTSVTASTSTSTSTTAAKPATPSSTRAGGGGVGIIPDSIRAAGAAARMSFIQSQRERLRVVLSALDREEAQAHEEASEVAAAAAAAAALRRGSVGGGGSTRNNGEQEGRSTRSLSGTSLASAVSGVSVGGTSGSRRSRSEGGDFEKVEVEVDVGLEEEEEEGGDGVRRRTGGRGGQRQEGATGGGGGGGGRGGGWMSWVWGGGEEAGKSSGVEK